MKVERMKWITREIVRANPFKIFLFGDNVDRFGLGGQAREMRGEPNAIGIVTKHSPTRSESAYMSDKDFADNCKLIDRDFRRIGDFHFEIVVIPSDGIGTGLAELDKRAPKTFAYLQQKLADLEHTLQPHDLTAPEP